MDFQCRGALPPQHPTPLFFSSFPSFDAWHFRNRGSTDGGHFPHHRGHRTLNQQWTLVDNVDPMLFQHWFNIELNWVPAGMGPFSLWGCFLWGRFLLEADFSRYRYMIAATVWRCSLLGCQWKPHWKKYTQAHQSSINPMWPNIHEYIFISSTVGLVRWI